MAQSIRIVIPATAALHGWPTLHACLDGLRPHLRTTDEVIVAHNGSVPEIARQVNDASWVKEIVATDAVTFGSLANRAASEVAGDILVFLQPDVLVLGRTLEALRTVLENDSSLGAVGPRVSTLDESTLSSTKAQHVEISPERRSSRTLLRAFAKEWKQAKRGQTTRTTQLDEACVVLPAALFHEIGGFPSTGTSIEATQNLSLKIQDAGRTLAIVDEQIVVRDSALEAAVAFVPSEARPLLSASLIVKDEESSLARCLESIKDLVDEIVIYDTGSTDRTLEIAKEYEPYGVRIIEGFWDDDFSRARNAAREACRGEWILSIDADEEYEGNAKALRETLTSAPHAAFVVSIHNFADKSKDDLTHRACRLFRREQFHWVGRLHEQVSPIPGIPMSPAAEAPSISLKHYGYLSEVSQSKEKAERNVRIATLDTEALDDNIDLVNKYTNLARSLVMSGDKVQAREVFRQANEHKSPSPSVRRTLYRSAGLNAVELGNWDEALTWADLLDRESSAKDNVHLMRATVFVATDRYEDALEQLDQLGDPQDDDGILVSPLQVHTRYALSYSGLQRWEEAAEAFRILLQNEAIVEPVWARAIEAFYYSGADFASEFQSIPAKNTAAILAHIGLAQPEAADACLEALFQDPDRTANVLALATHVAPQLELERALVWSTRLRNVNRANNCPLLAIARNANRTPGERIQAVAVLQNVFRDISCSHIVPSLAPEIEPERFADTLYTLNELDPTLLEPFIIQGVTTPERGLAMAQALHGLGASEEALAVVQFAYEAAKAEENVLSAELLDEAVQWLQSVNALEVAAQLQALDDTSPPPTDSGPSS